MTADPEFLHRLERELVDKGKLIEAGWVGLRIAAIPPDAGKAQLESMREAFFAGAQHLFGSIMGFLDDDHEPTDADLRRMDNVNTELTEFIEQFSRKHGLGPKP
jgi:hypothetical protein